MCRSLYIWLLAIIFTFPHTSQADDPPAPIWEHRGLADTEILTIKYMLNGIYVGATDGLHIRERDAGDWRILTRDGVAGWPVTAVGRAPFYPDHVITGRVGGDGLGAIASTDLVDGATALKLAGQPGPFTHIAHTEYFSDYRVWACAPGGEQNGVVLKSGSGGELWTELTGHGFTSPMAFSSTFTFQEGDLLPLTFLCGDGPVQESVDNGETFSRAFSGLPTTMMHDFHVGAICFVGLPKSTQDQCEWYFAATDDGFYFKPDEDTPWIRGLTEPCTKVRFEGGVSFLRVFVLTADQRLLSCDMVPGLGGDWQDWAWEDWATDLDLVAVTNFSTMYNRIAVATADGVYEKVWIIPSSDVPETGLPVVLSATPNPFNPHTTLSFAAPQSGHAFLAVYDLRGRQVATLLNDEVAAGPVSIAWQPRQLASGVYLARLQLNGLSAVRRVALVR